MKQTFAICVIALLLGSCKKDDTTVITPAATSGFSWSENGGATITADSAYYTAAYKTIMVWKAGAGKHIEVNLTAGTPATYAFASGSGNAFTLITGGANYAASGGSLIITANANSKMSGTFNTTGAGASVTAVTGTFTDIPVR